MSAASPNWYQKISVAVAIAGITVAFLCSFRQGDLSLDAVRDSIGHIGLQVWTVAAPLLLAALSLKARRNRPLAWTVVAFVAVAILLSVYEAASPLKFLPRIGLPAAVIIGNFRYLLSSFGVLTLAILFPRFSGPRSILQWAVLCCMLVTSLSTRIVTHLELTRLYPAVNWIDSTLDFLALVGSILLAYATLRHQSPLDPRLEDPLTSMALTCPRCSHALTAHPGYNECPACRLKIHIQLEDARCPQCQYPLRGLPTPTCPECGTTIAAPAKNPVSSQPA